MSLTKEFVDQSIFYIDKSTPRIRTCLDEINEGQLWTKPSPVSNSIGNIILHLCGNITQYILSALGQVEDSRDRPKEFSAEGGYNRSELISKLEKTVLDANEVIKSMDENRLLKIYKVQGEELSGVGIIVHVTEHYSYHTGQVAFYTKLLTNKDLGFYKDVDLNKKNEIG